MSVDTPGGAGVSLERSTVTSLTGTSAAVSSRRVDMFQPGQKIQPSVAVTDSFTPFIIHL